MSENSSHGSLLAPYRIVLKKNNETIQESLLWDLKGKQTAKDISRNLCSQHKLSEDSLQSIELQIQRGLRIYRDAGRDCPMVSILVHVPLGGEEVLVDRVMWDLNNPRFNVDMYAAALCRDFNLDWFHYANLVRLMKAKIDKCRQDLREGGGKTTLAVQPKIAQRPQPSSFPAIINLKNFKNRNKAGSNDPASATGEEQASQAAALKDSLTDNRSPAGPSQQGNAQGADPDKCMQLREEDSKSLGDEHQGTNSGDGAAHAEAHDESDDSDMPDLDFDDLDG